MLNIFAKETQEISQSSFLGFHFNNNIIEYKFAMIHILAYVNFQNTSWCSLQEQ